ncbi:hypothetical protein GUITHDRAFT_149697, partial [Guillardia theta CCMP2712]
HFTESQSKFYAAGIVLAFMYLHNRDILYRNLNPENVLVDVRGYIKLTDFQQAEGIVARPNNGRNEFTGERLKRHEYWTVTSHPAPALISKLAKSPPERPVHQHDRRQTTPHYLAPEVVSLRRHGKEADWWSLGILIHEMLCGYPPFFDSQPPGLYDKITREEIYFP